jgi:hypothetical protein
MAKKKSASNVCTQAEDMWKTLLIKDAAVCAEKSMLNSTTIDFSLLSQ